MSRALRLRFLGEEEGHPALTDIATLLNDLNLLYETSVLAAAPEYEATRAHFSSPWYYARNARRLRSQDRLRVEHLRQESPIDLQTVVLTSGAAIAGVVGVATLLEKFAKVRLERRKLLLEVEKLEREKASDTRETNRLLTDPEEFGRRLVAREAEVVYTRIGNRIERSRVRDPRGCCGTVRSEKYPRVGFGVVMGGAGDAAPRSGEPGRAGTASSGTSSRP